MGYLAPDKGVLNVWVRTVGKEDDRVITKDRKRGIRFFGWAEDSQHVLYIQDREGDENWHLYAVNLKTNAIRDLSPFEGVRVQGVFTDPDFPDRLLMGMNLRDPRVFDLYRVDLRTGGIEVEAESAPNYVGWLTDHDLRVRGAVAATPDGGFQLLLRKDATSSFEPFLAWGPDYEGNAIAFTPDGKGLYIEDNVESDTAELYEIDLATKKKKVLARDPHVDLGSVLIHPIKNHVQAVGFNLHRLEWTVLDQSIAADFEALKKVHPGEFSIINRDHADRTWLVAYTSDTEPVRYYAYERESKKATYLFSNRPALEKYKLAPMKPVTIKARDGLDLVSYLTVPVGQEPKKLPLVLIPHGGPWARNTWGYNGTAQLLANRGYAVLQVNFRGSAGFGRKFLHAGDREWGAKMHDDLIDAVNWAIKEGIADPKKVCIMGGSYGGYATLVGVTFTPDVFACGVDIVGPSNLVTLLKSVPPYWVPLLNLFRYRVGNEETEAEFLHSRSPLFKADQIKVPLLVAQGANDPRVKQAESEQIVAAVRKKGKDVVYLLFPDEGHGFARPENHMAFYAAAEEFLAKHLGGRVEPPSEAESKLLGAVRK
ncbi:MAG: S9 family peptidase [Acidobacteria bacterium]|nr:S9 family peptidase [Acidobacteriota bacterium]